MKTITIIFETIFNRSFLSQTVHERFRDSGPKNTGDRGIISFKHA